MFLLRLINTSHLKYYSKGAMKRYPGGASLDGRHSWRWWLDHMFFWRNPRLPCFISIQWHRSIVIRHNGLTFDHRAILSSIAPPFLLLMMMVRGCRGWWRPTAAGLTDASIQACRPSTSPTTVVMWIMGSRALEHEIGASFVLNSWRLIRCLLCMRYKSRSTCCVWAELAVYVGDTECWRPGNIAGESQWSVWLEIARLCDACISP